MDNQQRSSLEERIWQIALNAKFGDGCFYINKHQGYINAQVHFTSINIDWLEQKRKILPEYFTGKIQIARKANAKNCFANSKTLYKLQSRAYKTFTEVYHIPKSDLINSLTLKNLGMWYLDDGGCIIRNEKNKQKGKLYSGSVRYYLCIGDTDEKLLKIKLKSLFGKDIGHIRLNGSNATQQNKIWIIHQHVAEQIMKEAQQYNVMPKKFLYGKRSTTIETTRKGQGSRVGT